MPIFACRPSTMKSLSPVNIPQSSVVGQQRQQISELQFDKFPSPSSFLFWKIRFKNQMTTCSDFPSETMLWIKEVEMVDSVDELKSSRSIAGKNFPNFEMLDAKIASASNRIIQNSHFKKKVSLEEQKAQKEDRFLRGRQMAFMISDSFRFAGAPDDAVLDYADLFPSLFVTIMFRIMMRSILGLTRQRRGTQREESGKTSLTHAAAGVEDERTKRTVVHDAWQLGPADNRREYSVINTKAAKPAMDIPLLLSTMSSRRGM